MMMMMIMMIIIIMLYSFYPIEFVEMITQQERGGTGRHFVMNVLSTNSR